MINLETIEQLLDAITNETDFKYIHKNKDYIIKAVSEKAQKKVFKPSIAQRIAKDTYKINPENIDEFIDDFFEKELLINGEKGIFCDNCGHFHLPEEINCPFC